MQFIERLLFRRFFSAKYYLCIKKSFVATIRKTSEEIKLDIRPMADLSTNEIAAYLGTNGYSIDFEDATPVWLMRNDRELELREH